MIHEIGNEIAKRLKPNWLTRLITSWASSVSLTLWPCKFLFVSSINIQDHKPFPVPVERPARHQLARMIRLLVMTGLKCFMESRVLQWVLMSLCSIGSLNCKSETPHFRRCPVLLTSLLQYLKIMHKCLALNEPVGKNFNLKSRSKMVGIRIVLVFEGSPKYSINW